MTKFGTLTPVSGLLNKVILTQPMLYGLIRNNPVTMTGIKVALSCVGIVTGGASALTGTIFANVPGISPETPVNLTFALVLGGIATTATLAWKVSRAWSKMETKVEGLQLEIKHLRKELGED